MTKCTVLIVWAVVLSSTAVLSDAFISRPTSMQSIRTKLYLKITVPTRFPFRPNNSEHHNEHVAEDDEEVYHRRIVHFELSSEHTHATSSNNAQPMRKYRNESSSSNENRRFGWDHCDFMQSVDP
eukprot:45782_1